MKHPTLEAVRAIHRQVLKAHGGLEGIRSVELLESAIAAPQASMMGQPLFTDPIEIAAAYLFYLCSNRPFYDGNKRVALATCLVFLVSNGHLSNTRLDVDRWEALTMDVAGGKLSREQTTERLRELIAS